ncbi:MAG: replicative DNA helicase [Candidatus Liptonbacteria bacterium RIFCSPHIGHO2_01_FULL_57_28]|uniref:Replicative DNA helicase n=1 Tax=Candidatus Liptonbacteria bacterium RIFCSPHIGHO2_01_FULL_57_28 TaxID=1798647 RepID=A0A1G2CB33_9BACT|nr:MAG: replicative DNA helicase [Candidatus Liptonbacteria bacterium RIFCSPHIGHO2_01_FULL_57_28]
MAKRKDLDIKVPPQNVDAEQSVLGSLLIDPNAMVKVLDILAPEDFYNPVHGKVYATILALYEKRQPVDVMSVTTALKEKDELKSVGGSAYLADLTNRVTTASHVEHYAQLVKDKKTLRELIKTSAEVTEEAFSNAEDVEALLDGIEQKILNISQKSTKHSFTHIKDELKGAYERMEHLNAGGGALRGVPTGFPKLDTILSGLQKSDLIILGARPSIGKTTFALDIARNVALRFKQPVGLFSIEMAREQVVDRIIAAEAGVSLWKLRTGRVNEDVDFQMIQGALDRLTGAELFIDDTPSQNILQMRSMARRLQIEHGLGLIVVDYLQLITPRSTKSDNVVQQVTEISRGLKTLARELHVPVLALSQLSREVDKLERTPKLSDLRESGSIEQDADVVMFLSREKKDPSQMDMGGGEPPSVVHLHVAKHRNGPLGNVDFQFDQDLVTFRSIDTRHEPTGFDQ